MRTSCIRLRAQSRVAVLYEDFLEICEGNMLAALLLSVIIYWTDVKLAKKEDLWIWKSHEGFQEDLLFDKPGMKPPHRTSISAALELLRKKGFIEWRKNPRVPLDRTRQYLAHQDAIQAAIDRLPTLDSRKSSVPLSENRQSTEKPPQADASAASNVGKPTMHSRKTDNAQSENRQCTVGKPTSNTSDYDSVITDSVITQEVCSGVPATEEPAINHTHTSPLPVGDFEEDGITDLEEEDETPTEARIPAVPSAPGTMTETGGRTVSVAASPRSSSLPESPSQDADGRVSPPAVVGQPVAPVPPGKAAKRPAKAAKPVDIPLEATLSEDEQALYHEWCSLFRVAVPLSPSVAKAAKTLACPLAVWAEALKVGRAEVLKQMRAWEYACNNGNGFYSRKGVKLSDLERDFEAWQSSMQQQMDSRERGPSSAPEKVVPFQARTGKRLSSFDDPNFDFAAEFYPASGDYRAAAR